MNQEEINKLYTPEQHTKTITTQEYQQKYIDKEATMKACKECPNYSKNWACPEFHDNPYKQWNNYKNIKLIMTKINYTQKAQQNQYTPEQLNKIIENTLFQEKKKLQEKLEQEEKKYHGRILSAGYCTHCNTCTRTQNKPCKHPEKLRNSIESIGGLVTETLRGEFNEEIKWIREGKLPTNLTLLMALLY
ncbi:DUF2284 domain-containing protein [Methanosphaera sp. ISO3-F5]|uniref:DUF2284 domain-containing protein n=1 Tax=Methanosphaera sp. ISO3-F5 TaxID=1452353 RepID=UPI002B25F258|nr:DUF2284 domain-containing protein [Methanosphaera sp. ISO3-F5]WQH63913.1 DUF2284 domain-containing protein [Methanosphaera sp. ISO3-F5]